MHMKNGKAILMNLDLEISWELILQMNSPGLIFLQQTILTNITEKTDGRHLTVISMAIGQGRLEQLLLQMANMTAAIANRGYYYITSYSEICGSE